MFINVYVYVNCSTNIEQKFFFWATGMCPTQTA